MNLLGYLALRDLVATRWSLALLVLAIAIGVGFQIPNTANLAGSTATLLEESLVWGPGDVRIEPATHARFADGDAAARRVAELVGGGARVVPVLQLAGAVGGGRGTLVATPIIGIDAPGAPIHVIEGSADRLGDTGLVLGSERARRLGVGLGDPVELRVIFSDPGRAPADDDLGAYTMIVRGIAGGTSGASRFAFVDRGWLARALGEPGAASNLYVHLADHDAAEAVAAALPIADRDLLAISWQRDDPQLPNLIGANRMIDRVSYGMVIAAVSVPLLALLYLRVLRRRRPFALLAALGLTRGELFAIAQLQALVVGVVGALAGAAIGYGAIAHFERSPIFAWEGVAVRPLVTPATFLGPIGVVLATTLAAGALAAWRAARTPVARILQRLE